MGTKIILRASLAGEPVKVGVTDLDAFIHAPGDAPVCCYAVEDGEESPLMVRKCDLSGFDLDEV